MKTMETITLILPFRGHEKIWPHVLRWPRWASEQSQGHEIFKASVPGCDSDIVLAFDHMLRNFSSDMSEEERAIQLSNFTLSLLSTIETGRKVERLIVAHGNQVMWDLVCEEVDAWAEYSRSRSKGRGNKTYNSLTRFVVNPRIQQLRQLQLSVRLDYLAAELGSVRSSLETTSKLKEDWNDDLVTDDVVARLTRFEPLFHRIVKLINADVVVSKNLEEKWANLVKPKTGGNFLESLVYLETFLTNID